MHESIPPESGKRGPAGSDVLGWFPRGHEDEDADALAMTVFEQLGDSPLELFHPLQDDDTGYEVEDYAPEA